MALLLAAAFAISGVLRWKGTGIFRGLLLLGATTPTFLLGIAGLIVLYQDLGWLPAGGQVTNPDTAPGGTGFMLIDALTSGQLGVFGDALKHLVLPALALGIGPAVAIGRVFRTSILDTPPPRAARKPPRPQPVLRFSQKRRRVGLMDGIPGRVVGLIEASGLSRGAFAHQVGLDDSKLSKSLSGARRFTSLDLARIAELCHVSVDWLVTGEDATLAVAARTTTRDARTAIEAARRYAGLRADMAFLGYPQPWAPVPADLAAGSPAGQGGRLAERALARVAQLGRSVAEEDLPLLVEEAFGADVAVVGLDEGFDGLAASSPDAKVIVLGTSRVPARQRYTLAHELGHLLAGDDQGIHLDNDVYGAAQRGDASEARANSFAAAFLMPEDKLRGVAASPGLTEAAFAALACDLKVSPSALAIRLRRLGLIDAEACDRLMTITGARAAAIAGRGEDFARRVTMASTPRLPGLLVQDAYAAYESGAATLRPYASLLEADVDDLRRALEWEGGAIDE